MQSLRRYGQPSITFIMRKIALENSGKPQEPDLHTEWEQALGQSFTPTEFDEIKTNLRDFFELLHSWHIKKELKRNPENDSTVYHDSGGGSV